MTCRSRARGFTLIEILVVMALIGLILALVVPRIQDALIRGKRHATEIKLDTLGGKITTYSMDNGTPPKRLEDLVAKPAGAANWLGPYASDAEIKDAWGVALVYRAPGTHDNAYDLYSFGPDGREGGEGIRGEDITNWRKPP